MLEMKRVILFLTTKEFIYINQAFWQHEQKANIQPIHSFHIFRHFNKDFRENRFEFKPTNRRGAWVAQSVKPLTSAQVMISRFVGSSPTSGSVLTVQSLELLRILCLLLSAPTLLALSVSKK